MTTSNTFNYAPNAGDLTYMAFARIGKRRAQVLSEHLVDAYNEANLMLSDWSTRPGPNFWATDTVSVPLIINTATYTLSATTIQVLAAYTTITSGSTTTDRTLGPISTTDYAALANKTQTGSPTIFWFDRQITPQITVYPVPNASSTYTLKLRRWRQLQDTVLAGGIQPEVPQRFLDTFVWGLAARLAYIYPPNPPLSIQEVEMRAEKAWLQATTNDSENVPIRVSPGLGSYYN